MDTAGLYQLLAATGYPVAYRQFRTAEEPPFIVYYFVESADLTADNVNYHPLGDYHIELYTNQKDPEAEAAVESKLRDARLPYRKLEAYIESEDLYQVLYQVRLIGGNDGEQG